MEEHNWEVFFAQQDMLLALPDEDMESYLARRANPSLGST